MRRLRGQGIYSKKSRQSEEMVSAATKLEQYTCTCLINHLFFFEFFKENDSRIIGLFV